MGERGLKGAIIAGLGGAARHRWIGCTLAVAVLATIAAPAARAQVFGLFRFAPRAPLPLAVGEDAGPQAMALADVNGDGHLDLIAINRDDDRVSVLLGDGEGGLALHVAVDLDVSPAAVAVADVGSDFSDESAAPDGHPDLIVAAEDGYPVILLGDGLGGFSGADAQDLSELVDGDALVGLAVADFDGNDEPDLALADESNQVYFLCNDEGEYMPCASDLVATDGEGPVDIVAGDFDGDRHADVAVLNRDSRDTSVAYGDGRGGFTAARQTFPAQVDSTNVPRALAAARIDAGNTDDLVIVNDEEFSDLGVLALFGVARNRFRSEGFTVPFSATDLAIADMNGDAALDLLIASNADDASSGPTLLAGSADSFDQTLFAAPGAERMPGGRAILAGDVGGDALPDIVQLAGDGDAVQVAINVSNELPPLPTATPTPTRVPIPGAEDDGCSVAAGPGRPAVEWAVPLAMLVLLRVRRRRD